MPSLSRFVSDQLRRPTGAFGRLVMTRLLDRGNGPMIEQTLARLDLRRGTAYLDVGFGGGEAIRRAAEVVRDAPIYGVDVSPDVVRSGHRRFRALVTAGRLSMLQADVTDMPLRSGLFERISTMNTVYFWPDPPRAAAEVFRLLGAGGRVAIGYTGADKMRRFPRLSEGFTLVQPGDVEGLLGAAGFRGVKTDALAGRVVEGDFVTVGTRPAVGG